MHLYATSVNALLFPSKLLFAFCFSQCTPFRASSQRRPPSVAELVRHTPPVLNMNMSFGAEHDDQHDQHPADSHQHQNIIDQHPVDDHQQQNIIDDNDENVDPSSLRSKQRLHAAKASLTTNASSTSNRKRSLGDALFDDDVGDDDDDSPPRRSAKVLRLRQENEGEFGRNHQFGSATGNELGGKSGSGKTTSWRQQEGLLYAEREKTRDAVAVASSFNGMQYQLFLRQLFVFSCSVFSFVTPF